MPKATTKQCGSLTYGAGCLEEGWVPPPVPDFDCRCGKKFVFIWQHPNGYLCMKCEKEKDSKTTGSHTAFFVKAKSTGVTKWVLITYQRPTHIYPH